MGLILDTIIHRQIQTSFDTYKRSDTLKPMNTIQFLLLLFVCVSSLSTLAAVITAKETKTAPSLPLLPSLPVNGDYQSPATEQPPDVAVLGRSAWTLIHTMAVRYPEHPSQTDRIKMNAFLDAIAEFYPCALCASHLRSYLRDHPADVTSRTSLRRWLCDLHNSVNSKLKKPAFDCNRVPERWGGQPQRKREQANGCESGFCRLRR